ncbi:MAG: hypothetical protein ACQKBU_09260 [Verrucomicrobiales bacterium]
MGNLLSVLDLESLPQLSLGTAGLLIFGAIASLAVLRGLLRILWGTLVLCLAGFLAFLTWQNSPDLPLPWVDAGPSWMPLALPPAVFFLTVIVLRTLSRWVVKPLGDSNDEAERNRRSPLRWATTLLFSLAPTLALWFGGATLLRHWGSVAEVRQYVEKSVASAVESSSTEEGDSFNPSPALAFWVGLKDAVEDVFPKEWFSLVDPLADEARIQLAKLISVAETPPPKAIPVLETPEIQELILEDEHLRRLAKEGRYAEVLRDPRLDRVLENEDLREVLKDLDL